MNLSRISVFVAVSCLLLSSIASAEVKTYEGTGEYIMSDFETPDIAKQRAKSRAEQACVEQAGVYVKSYTKTVNSVVTEDEVEAIANNIINIIDEKYTVIPLIESGGSFRVLATVKANVDSERIETWLGRDRYKNLGLIEENKKLQEERVKQDKQIEDLQKKLAIVTDKQKKEKIEMEVATADKQFLVNQKIEEGKRCYEAQKYVDAVAIFSQAIGIDETSSRAYCERAGAYLAQHDVTRGLKDINKAIELDNNNAKAYAQRSLASAILGNYQQAESDIAKSIKIAPDEASGYFVRGLMYCDKGEYKLAINDLNEVVKLRDKEPASYVSRAFVYIMQGDNTMAMNDINKALELNPKFPKCYSLRGEIYLRQQNRSKALEDFTMAINLGPKEEMAYVGRAKCYGPKGEYQKAVNDLDMAISINPRNAAAYQYRGIIHCAMKSYQQSLDDYNKTIELNPDNGYNYMLRGEIYQVLGNMHQADIDFAKAKSLGYVA